MLFMTSYVIHCHACNEEGYLELCKQEYVIRLAGDHQRHCAGDPNMWADAGMDDGLIYVGF